MILVNHQWERLIELRAGPSDPTRGTTLCQTILLGQIYAALAEVRIGALIVVITSLGLTRIPK